MSLFDQINLNNVPKHIAIIMDGNGRWAKKQGEFRLFGHNAGVETIRETLKAAEEIGVKYLTLYTFSIENWNRPKDEVDGIMELLVQSISNELEDLHAKKVRMWFIGNQSQLSKELQDEMNFAMDKTKNNNNIHLIFALNYSSRWEITNAIKEISKDVKNNKISIDKIDDELISNYLCTKHFPDPELLIRTSGEYRISNFLLWQIAYTELHFTDVLWPEFTNEDLYKAILDYQNRERRFGKITEQL
ncbi:MAG: isoprenyl transferase [Flavobacteriia bacterium]|nr:isoprenyl transferase [Flavobacteriia bacterium]